MGEAAKTKAPEITYTTLDGLSFYTQAVSVAENGDVTFDAVAVDKNKAPNRKGFVFDWDKPEDVLVENWLANPVVFYMHEHEKLPIGVVESVKVTAKRVLVRVKLPSFASDPELAAYDAQVLAPIRGYVRQGMLRAVSIGFYIVREEPIIGKDGQEQGARIKSFEIVELSVVTMGAHETALIQDAGAESAEAEAIVRRAFEKVPVLCRGTSDGQELYTLSLAAGEPAEPDIEVAEIAPDAIQPFPNEHACRLQNPDLFKPPWARVKRQHDGKPYDVIRGTKINTGKMEDQSFRYPKKVWSPDVARAHCKAHEGTFEAATGQDSPSLVEQAGAWRAIPFSRHGDKVPKAAEGASWDGPRETAAADVDDLKIMCALEDADALDVKGGYKLPHHTAGNHAVVIQGCLAAMGAVLGARGGVKGASVEARKGAHAHLAKEYKRFDKDVPDFRQDSYSAEELAEMHRAGMIIVPGVDAQDTDGERLPDHGLSIEPPEVDKEEAPESREELAVVMDKIAEELAELRLQIEGMKNALRAALDRRPPASGPDGSGGSAPVTGAAAPPAQAGPPSLAALAYMPADTVRALVRGILEGDASLKSERAALVQKAIQTVKGK